MFKDHTAKINQLLLQKLSVSEREKIIHDHQIMIVRIQHERLIHLLVTIFVGIVMTASAFITMIAKELIFLAIWLPLLVLFIGYLLHYRYLENTTQSWYELEDKMKDLF